MTRLATVVYHAGQSPDDAILSAVRGLPGVRGYVQARRGDGGLALLDVADGVLVPLGGPAGGGCRLDPAALDQAAAGLEARLTPPPSLLVLNRFGDSEAAGFGFRPLLETAVEAGIPVLLAVANTRLALWQAYAGEMGETLPCSKEAVSAWAAPLARRS
ncbi:MULTISPECIES: DUF2478 domain-containing protein [unclassified Haematobacter]|uniref:DUF2478 domain-containing protein n=1 Tax=unclassified Haematobacter TaxID=2640585 RepID=UPI0025BA565F|nr:MULTISPECIES: DUF2478 domain-containing protein [unclassified Haematobacter]